MQKALALDPDLVEASYNLGNAWLQSGKTAAAVQQWQKVLARQPDYVAALNNLGNYFLQHGETQTALGYLQKAVAIQPDFADANNNLGDALIESGRVNDAIPHFKRALKIRPNYVGALNNLGWVLATCPLDTLRNGEEALGLARRANQLSGGNNPLILRTLAAAFAENGQFADAMAADRQAVRLLQPDSALAANIQAQIQLYKAGQPFRDATLIKRAGP